jgi:hypothetical protein
MEGSHSPLGFIWQIASQTGWNVHYILWKIPYPALLLMMTDAPRYVDADELKRRKIKDRRQEIKDRRQGINGQNALQFFQTRLSNNEQ